MIKVPFPHMVLNSHNLPFGEAQIQMWNTYNVPKDHSVDQMLGWTAKVARAAPGGKLATLVFSCHGFENQAGVGGYGLDLGKGIRRVDTPRFEALRGLVDQIMIFACQAAAIAVPTGPGSTVDGDGNLFCCEIAKQSKSYVTASQADVANFRYGSGIGGGIPVGYIPDWMGMVVTFGPLGNVVATKKW